MNTEQTTPYYASIGRRFVAVLLDALILVIPAAMANHVIPVAGGILITFFYAPVLESSEVRATIGKHLMGIQVCDLAGRRISFRAAVIRYFMKIVSSVFLFLGHVVAFFTERKQALHDLVAETIVVYGRSEKSIFDAWMDQCKSIFGSQQVREASRLSELERLQALRERGALSEEEFQKEKKRVMGE